MAKPWYVAFFVFAAALLPPIAKSAGHLTAKLAAIQETGHVAGTRVAITLENDGDEPVYLSKYATPEVLLDGVHLQSSFFRVIDISDPNQSEVRYTGFWSRPISMSESYFIAVDPNKKISYSYDLKADYALKPGGLYQIAYRQDLTAVPFDTRGEPVPSKIKKNAQDFVWSNTIEIYVSLTESMHVPSSSRKIAADAPFSFVQRAALTVALQNAQTIANDTLDYHTGLPRPGVSTRYVWWFGAYGAGSSDSDNRTDQVIGAIQARLTNGFSQISFQNGCPPGTLSDTAAIAQTATLYLIRICPRFFQLAALSDLDNPTSQASTIIHEVSHFSDQYSDFATGDYGGYTGYILSGAHSLAQSDRDTAVKNASNYEFYSVNTPAR